MQRRVALFLFALTLAGLLTGCLKKHAAGYFFDYLTAGELEEAFQYVSYFDHYLDVAPETPYETAEHIWTERVERLREEGIYIESYRDLDITVDDWYPIGRVKLVVVEGSNKINCEATLNLTKLHGKWKVAVVHIYISEATNENPALLRLEEALCGKVGE